MFRKLHFTPVSTIKRLQKPRYKRTFPQLPCPRSEDHLPRASETWREVCSPAKTNQPHGP